MNGHHRHPWGRAALTVVACMHLAAGGVLAQDDADRAYRSATGLLNRGMHELAAEEYRAFLKSHPEDPKAVTARYGLGVCLSRMGKHAEASAELAKVVGVKGFEFEADAELLLGQSELLSGEDAAAAKTLAKFVADHADHAQADAGTALLGEAQMRAGKPDDAVRTFAVLAERWPKSASRARAELLWAICDSTAGRTKEAAARLGKLRQGSPDGAMMAQATLLEAQCRHRLGERDKALGLYREVAKGAEGVARADAQLGIAQLERAGGKVKEASKILEQVVTTPAWPSEGAARLELARCRLDEGNAAGAIFELSRMPKETPAGLRDDVAYWSARARAQEGKFDDAATLLDGCEDKFKGSELLAEMLYARADALSRIGRQKDADKVFSLLSERFPEHSVAADAALARLTSAYKAGDDATAHRLASTFVKEHPEHAGVATAELVLAECLYRAGKMEEAERAYSGFIERHPKDANAGHAALRRGLCLSRLGKKEAAGMLENALKNPGAGDPALRMAAMVALADGAFAASDWKGAERWFALAAASTPDDELAQDVLLKLGLSIHRQGRAADALPSYDALIARYPKGKHTTQATFERGQALLELGRDEEASVCFTQVIATEKGEKDARFAVHAKRHLATLAMKAGRADEAAALLGEVATASGDSGGGRARLDQGLALLSAGEFAKAEAALKEAAGAPEAQGAEARASLGVSIARQGRLEDALAVLQASTKDSKELSAETREMVAYERASVLRRMGRDADALSAYEEFLSSSPSARLAAHAALESAQLQAKAERFEECLRVLDTASKSAESAGAATKAAIGQHAAYLRGLAQHRTGKSSDAVRTLTALLKEQVDPSLLAPASLVCGEALLKTNQPAEAAKRFQSVLKATKDAETVGPALLRLGEACAAAQDWVGSEAAFADFLSRFPDSPVWFQARFGMGWAAENQGRHDAALDAYRAVVAKHDGATAARAQFQIGECLYAQKKLDEAVKELLRVDILYSYPEWSAAALYEAGRCLTEQGKQAEARRQFEDVIKRFPETAWAVQSREAIERTKAAPLPGRTETDAPKRNDRKERAR